MVEVILVLVIGAIMYSLIVSVAFRGSSSADLKAAARTVAAGLRQAQTIAMMMKPTMSAIATIITGCSSARALRIATSTSRS